MTHVHPEITMQSRAHAGFPAVRSLLAPDALAQEIENTYAIGPVRRCTLLRSLINDVYEITTQDARYVLKVYGPGHRMHGEIAWEVEMLTHLIAKQVTVAPTILRADGGHVGTLRATEGVRHTVLFAFAEGAKPEGPSQDLYHRFGRAIAQFHQATDDFTTRQPGRVLDLTYLLDRSLAIILPALTTRAEDYAFIVRLGAATRARIAELVSQGLDWGVCHGDVSLDNIHITNDRQIILYDFDLSGLGWRACDPYGVMTWITRGKPEYWAAFLVGYQEVRALTRADQAAMPWFVPIRLLDNMRFHLDDWCRLRGALALNDSYIDDQLTTLRQWDRDVLNGTALAT